MTDESCMHPPSSIIVKQSASETDIGNPPPGTWTLLGKCDCGAEVELDYTFKTITEA